MKCAKYLSLVVLLGIGLAAWSQEAPKPAEPPSPAAAKVASQTDTAAGSTLIPPGAKVYVAPMPDKFDDFLKAAIQNKKVPIVVVANRDEAEFELTGYSESQKASTAKKLIMGSWHSRESASIKVANLKTSAIVFAYSYNTDNSAHGKKSSAESCSKHLKEKIESHK